MRSKYRIQKPSLESRRMCHNSARKMAVILQMERKRYRATVAELQTTLQNEREEINLFLKDMKKLIDDMPVISMMHQQQRVILIK